MKEISKRKWFFLAAGLLFVGSILAGCTIFPPTNISIGSDNENLTIFVDKNNYYKMNVPADWAHTQSSGDHYYLDTFTAPDGKAMIENAAYDNGTPFTGPENGQFALSLLDKLYSNTGQAQDLQLQSDSIQMDGSERLTWTSVSGDYSGVSFLEVRGTTTLLILTARWTDAYQSKYMDLLDKVVSSYEQMP